MFGINLSKWCRDEIIALRDECNRVLDSGKTYADDKGNFYSLETKCTCHERDSSYVCDYCYSQGFRGHMQESNKDER